MSTASLSLARPIDASELLRAAATRHGVQRAFELYGWHPDGQPQPFQPRGYPDNWLSPMPSHSVRIEPTNGRDYPGLYSFIRSLVETGISPFGGRTFALINQRGDWTADTIVALLEAFPDSGIPVVASAGVPTRQTGVFAPRLV